MATSVGSVAIDILSGNVNPQRPRMETWHIPGVTGQGAQNMGSNQASFAYRATLYGTAAAVETRLVALAAVQGTVVTIEDDFGKQRANCLVTQVGTPQRKDIIRLGLTGQMRAVVSVAGIVVA